MKESFDKRNKGTQNPPEVSAAGQESQEDNWIDIQNDVYHGDTLQKAWAQLLMRLNAIEDARAEIERIAILKAQRPSEVDAISKQLKTLEEQYDVAKQLPASDASAEFEDVRDHESPPDVFPPGYGGDE